MGEIDDEDDPWLRQFLAGAERREARARATGWGCFIAVVLLVAIIVLVASATGK